MEIRSESESIEGPGISDVILEDTTLRDGEQAPGIALPPEAKIRIHDALVDAGVKWIEAGIPAMGGTELEYIQRLLARGSEATLIGWNRGILEDIKFSIDLGFRAVHIGLPTSDGHLKNSIGRDRSWLLQRSRELISFAKDRDCFVSVSAEDMGRTDIGFLQEYAVNVTEAGADRLRLSDTVGILSPHQYSARVKAVRVASRIPLQCHAHNDFGLAVANTLAGLEAGATYFHVTVSGLGERAGMPDLAQVALALKCIYKCDLGLRLDRLSDLYRIVFEELRVTVPPWQPIIGSNVFAHESGIHANGMLKDETTFEAFSPRLLGKEHRLVLGKHSGRAALAWVLSHVGIHPSEEELSKCLRLVREVAIRQRGEVTVDRAREIYESMIGK